jgi:hypothetical protein
VRPRRSAAAALLAASLGADPAFAAEAVDAPPAPAQPLAFTGEYMRWEIKYMGVTGGFAEAWTEAGEDGRLVTTGIAQNAPWYAKVYTLDDRVRSTWDPAGGSAAYDTWFREGGFQQDQEMRLSADGIHVDRRQLGDEGWREWSNDYPAHPGAEDPVSAFFRMRMMDLDTTQRFPVFSGKRTWTLEVVTRKRERLQDTPLGPVYTRVVELRTAHEGDLEQRGRFLLWLTDDARQVPVRMVVKTNVGPIKANLIAYEAPGAVVAEGEDGPG